MCVVERLRMRRAEIAEAIMARICDVAEGLGGGMDVDVEYEEGQRAAVAAVLDYALVGIEHGCESTMLVPSEALVQARRGARRGVGLGMILRSYSVAHAEFDGFVTQEIDRAGFLVNITALQYIRNVQVSLLDRVVVSVDDAYERELEHVRHLPVGVRGNGVVSPVEAGAEPGGQIAVAVGQFGGRINEGLLRVLRDDRGLRVVATELDQEALETVVAGREADVVILGGDSEIPRMASLLCSASSVGLVALVHRPTREYAVRLLAVGISGYLSTDASATEILGAVRLAARGENAFVSATSRQGLAGYPPGYNSLTPRERDVCELLSSGRKNAEIACTLGVSLETVRAHAKHIYRKLGVSSRVQLLSVGIPQAAVNQDDAAAR